MGFKALEFKSFVLAVLGKCSKKGKAAFKLSYYHNRGKLPNLNNPRDLSEIWIKYVLDGKVDANAWMADKYAVRQYVEEKGLGSILTPLLAVYDKAEDIKLEELPNRFALKANFGAAMNIICTDKSALDSEQVIKEVRRWLQPQHYSESERHYNFITPKVVCEEFIDDGTGGFPVDYKFLCIHGRVCCVLGVSGREEGHGSYLPYDTNWEPIQDYYRGSLTASNPLPKPDNLTEMIRTAELLSEGIDMVRVDLYSNGSRIWFGEMTLTPAGCIFHRWTQKALDELGQIYLTGK